MITMSTTVFKKTTLALIGLACAAGVIFSVGMKATNSNVDVNATYGNETVRVYLDKTTTIAGLGWWETDSTFIHIWDGSTDTYQQMGKLSSTLFYYDIVGATWDLFTNDGRGVEFYVYDRGSLQNQTEFAGGFYLKSNELNYFKLNSANGSAKQTYSLLNKEVEEVRVEILSLTCSSTQSAVQTAVDHYQALRAQGKTNLNTWTVATGDVTYFQRLSYFAQLRSVTL